MININRSNALVNVEEWYDDISKTFDVVVGLSVFRFEYLNSVDLDDDGSILEVGRVDEELVVVENELGGCGQVEVDFSAEVEVKIFLLVVIGWRGNADRDEVIVGQVRFGNK